MIEAARKSGYRRVISGVFTALVFFLFAYVMYRQWQTGHIHELKYPVAPILLSALGMFGLVVLMGLFWCRMLALMSRKSVPIRLLLHAHFVSWLARYIPGKVGQVIGKVVLGENAGFRRGTLVTSVFYEHAFFIGSGVSISLICLGPIALKRIVSPILSEQWVLFFALMLMAGLLLSVYLLPAVLRRLLKGRRGFEGTIPGGSVVSLFVAYHFVHIIAGLGFYVLLSVLVPHNSITFIEATGILTAAHIGGVMVIIAPAGLGVRDSLLALLLTPYMPMDQAILVSLITRAWSIVADGYVLAAVPVIGLGKRRSGRL